MTRNRTGPLLALAAVAVTWGAIPLIVRADVPASHLVAARVWFGAVALVAISAALGRFRLPDRHRGRIALAGTILAVHWMAFFLAVKTTTVAVALAVLYLGPVLAAAASPRLLGESLTRRTRAGLGLALAGTLLVLRPGGGATVAGVTAGAAAALTMAALFLVGKPAARDLRGLTVATGELIVAGVLLSPFAVRALQESRSAWPEMLLLGVVFTGIAGVVFWTTMGRLPVATVGVLMYLEPASAVLWAAVVLGEPADPVVWTGVALVLAGGIVAATEATREEVAVAPAAL
jgi:drug/metabolite transporter (DMT)-like permease